MSYSSKLTSKFKLTSVSNKLGAPIDGSLHKENMTFADKKEKGITPPKKCWYTFNWIFKGGFFAISKTPYYLSSTHEPLTTNYGNTFKFKSGLRNQDQKMP